MRWHTLNSLKACERTHVLIKNNNQFKVDVSKIKKKKETREVREVVVRYECRRGEWGCVGHTPKWDVSGSGVAV
jgi:hypothetical protein